jgi:hypothetical protein
MVPAMALNLRIISNSRLHAVASTKPSSADPGRKLDTAGIRQNVRYCSYIHFNVHFSIFSLWQIQLIIVEILLVCT